MRFDTAIADRVTAIVLFALGAAMLAGGFTMDRLEIRQIHPASIPGLVPMFLGAATMLCAVLLFAGTSDAKRGDTTSDLATREGSVFWGNLSVAALMSGGYAVFLVGRVPFFLATAIYISAFTSYFSWPHGRGRLQQVRTVAVAIAFGLVASGAISALFRFGFLVRLP